MHAYNSYSSFVHEFLERQSWYSFCSHCHVFFSKSSSTMSNLSNLYDSIYTDGDDLDVGMLAINEMYGHLNFESMSNYFSLKSYNNLFHTENNQSLSIFHFNIQSLKSNIVHLQLG